MTPSGTSPRGAGFQVNSRSGASGPGVLNQWLDTFDNWSEVHLFSAVDTYLSPPGDNWKTISVFENQNVLI